MAAVSSILLGAALAVGVGTAGVQYNQQRKAEKAAKREAQAKKTAAAEAAALQAKRSTTGADVKLGTADTKTSNARVTSGGGVKSSVGNAIGGLNSGTGLL